ncbi:hypothetical protein [uncultured Hymenobacter sp.]|uniref:hypothetical protein n=1 Tax=uncultured Hymenobacter sp. TaxID=170016 RepID=UPI0035C98FEA
MRSFLSKIIRFVGVALSIVSLTLIVLALGFLFLLHEPKWRHDVKVYVRNKSIAPLTISFVLPKQELLLDTVWWGGGGKFQGASFGTYVSKGVFLQQRREYYNEVFASYQPLLVQGSIDTVFRNRIAKWTSDPHNQWDETPAGFDPQFEQRKKVYERRMSNRSRSQNFPFRAPTPRNTVQLDSITSDSIRVRVTLAPDSSLLVGRYYYSSRSKDRNIEVVLIAVGSGDVLSSAQVKWQTTPEVLQSQPLNARSRLDKALKKLPKYQDKESYHAVEYIDYK